MAENKFIEVEYTGKIKDGDVFDTTDEKVARNKNIYNEKGKYGPVVVCLGQGHLIKGLEEQIKGNKPGSYTVELKSENAFGKRESNLLQLIPTNKLKQSNINPVPGLQLNVDGTLAIIKTVSSGRTIVDFNHPLAGKDIVYEIKILKEVIDEVEKVKSILELEARVKPNVELKDNKLVIKGIKNEAQEVIKKRLSEFIDKEIAFEENKSS